MHLYNSSKLTLFAKLVTSLVKTESSKKTGKGYFEDPEVIEFLEYRVSVDLQILYEERNEYLRLIQKYLEEKKHGKN